MWIWKKLQDYRRKARKKRLGRRLAQEYEEKGKFANLVPRAVVLIEVDSGEFVAGRTYLDVIAEWEKRFGEITNETFFYEHRRKI